MTAAQPRIRSALVGFIAMLDCTSYALRTAAPMAEQARALDRRDSSAYGVLPVARAAAASRASSAARSK